MPPSLIDTFQLFPLAENQHFAVELNRAMQTVLGSGRYILADQVAAFESELKAWLGCQEVVGVASGTDALELALRALDLRPEDGVILPSFAPSAVASAVHRAGGRVILADVEERFLSLSVSSVEKLIQSATCEPVKAIVAVHLYGQPIDWDPMKRLAEKAGVYLLEDCAQSLGAKYNGKNLGTLGDVATTSFYPTKNLAALGDGGAIFCKDSVFAERVRLMRQYGWRTRGKSEMMGINSRLDELQAAFLRVKLGRLTQLQEKRTALARSYLTHLRNHPYFECIPVRPDCEHGWHQFVIRSKHREKLIHHFDQAGIPVSISYPYPLHRQASWSADPSDFQVSEKAAAEVLSLPFHPYMQPHEVEILLSHLSSFTP